MKRGRRAAWALFLTWLLMTCAALLVPFDQSRVTLGRGFDKVAHTAMFTTLGVLGQVALPWLSLVLTVPLAAGLEYAQKQVPRRTFDRVDLYANLIGVVLGMLLGEAAYRLRK